MERVKGVDLGSSEQAKGAIRYHAENDPTWTHHEIAKQLYGWTDRFRDRLIEPIAIPGKEGKLPAPVIGFASFDHRALAFYTLGHNAHGLEDEIILNELHLGRPLYAVLETVLHEQLHLWQQRHGEHPVTRNYHNKEFCLKAMTCGLNVVPVVGCHYKQAGEPFEGMLREYGIVKPPEEIEVPEGVKKNWWEVNGNGHRGRSTLEKWSCPECKTNVRVGVRRDLHLICGDCRDKLGYEVMYTRAR